jgi:UDP-N-acetylmuramate--alanine ligase
VNQPILSILREGIQPLRIHLIGVAGSGMSGLAGMLMALGHRVSGSDRVSTVETDRLRAQGLLFSSPHGERDVDGVDLVVYSSAIKAGNAAYDAAERHDIPLARRAEALSAVMANKRGIVVAGTHGKTTTSALAAHLLRVGGLKPSHYVGAEIPILGSNACWDPEGEHLVAEGDESDGTLVCFEPEYSILLNVEEDHLDFYHSLDEIEAVFSQLLAQTSGVVIYCGEDVGAAKLGVTYRGAVSYGWGREHHYGAEVVRAEAGGTAFRAWRRGAAWGEFFLGIPGRHNVLNALAALALADLLGVGRDDLLRGLASFRGARRRFEVKHRGKRLVVVDDYGHHPTEVAATLATARGLEPSRVICAFQPHRYSRTQLLKKEFGRSFGAADRIFIGDIYAASERPLPGVSGQTIVEEIQRSGQDSAIYVAGKRELRNAVANALRPGDLLLTLGAGDIHEIASGVAARLEILEAVYEVMGDEGVARLFEPMSKHTTIRIGGPAEYWIEPYTEEAFARVVRLLRGAAIPIRVVGRGSNLLVRDGGIRGAVIHPGGAGLAEVRVEGERIIAGVGARLKKVASVARAAGLGGFEWMEGIPGNVGGSLRMNAGAMGVETFHQVESVRYIDLAGDIREKGVGEIEHFYRHVPELQEHIAVGAVFVGKKSEIGAIQAGLEASRQKRKSTQPVAASAGCIFKNPGGCPAGRLVDELGFKGRSVGAAEVSEIHGNFIVNRGGARASDVLGLAGLICETAREQRGIELEMEVQVIGEESEY